MKPITFERVCGLSGRARCYEQEVCFSDGTQGSLFEAYRGDEYVGRVCLTDEEAEEQGQITPGQVLRAFQRLDWPSSELVVQPPGGRTLVNFETNFYTENTEPSTQQVTLLGQQVTIEASPVEYVWVFGDGEALQTSEAGAPYPALEVTHNYPQVGQYAPRVDTVYEGRYRVGGGPWVPIPETLTVTGESVALETVEAEPKLVGTP